MSNLKDVQDRDEVHDIGYQKDDVPEDWRPGADTVQAIECGEAKDGVVPDNPMLKRRHSDPIGLTHLSGTRSDQTDDRLAARSSAGDTGFESDRFRKGHLVPQTVVESVDTVVDERRARDIAGSQFPRSDIDALHDGNLRGVAYEGIVHRYLEDSRGPDKVETHPQDLTLADGRRISPDFAVRDEQGNLAELHDAKGYTRKEDVSPNADASQITHFSKLKEASRYRQVHNDTVNTIVFELPRETADMKSVQEAVAAFSSEKRSVRIESVGSEADLKQRMADLRKGDEDTFDLSEHVKQEIERIQSLPIERRRAAFGDFVQSLTDKRDDETTEGRNLRWSTRIERAGKGVTVRDDETGLEYSLWYE